MANVGGFLQALGQAFGGYSQDVQTRINRQQAAAQLAMQQRGADDAHVNALLERATNYPLISAGSGPSGVAGTPFDPTGALGKFLPSGSVNVPGYGTVDPFGKTRMGLIVDAVKRRNETDEKIRESEATGATGEHKSKTELNNREIGTPRLGDTNYADALGEVEAKKALATLPIQTRLEVLRGNISLANALTLQHGQQGFEQGQQGRQFQYDADKAAREMAGHFANQSAIVNQQQRGTIAGHFFAPAPMTLAPSQAIAPTGPANAMPKLTGEQIVRAARDPQYKAFLQSQGYFAGAPGTSP